MSVPRSGGGARRVRAAEGDDSAPLGGALLTQATLRAAEAKAPVLPRCVVRRVEKTPGNWEVRRHDPVRPANLGICQNPSVTLTLTFTHTDDSNDTFDQSGGRRPCKCFVTRSTAVCETSTVA